MCSRLTTAANRSFRLSWIREKMKMLGVSGQEAGDELRTQVQGSTPAKFRQGGLEYNIRVRLIESQRNLQKDFLKILVPNQNGNQVRLSDIASPVTTEGPSEIDRENRARYVQITGQLAPGGSLGNVLQAADKIMKGIDFPPGVTYRKGRTGGGIFTTFWSTWPLRWRWPCYSPT